VYCFHSRTAIFTAETAKERLNIIHVTIEEQTINPTNEQAQACVRVCQMLSNTYKDIHLFRFDIQTKDIYILAGENLQIIVPHNGN
jgi:hypothetical protein